MLPAALLGEFEAHAEAARAAHRARKATVRLTNVVDDREERQATSVYDTLGKAQPADKFEGDTNLRTLRTLLGIIDGRGWERGV